MPAAPHLERAEVGVLTPGKVAVGLAGEPVDVLQQVGPRLERRQRPGRLARVGRGRDVELRAEVAQHLLVAARLEEGDDLGRLFGRPCLQAALAELARGLRELAPALLVDGVEVDLGPGQVLLAWYRADGHE
jgi:hypothetical protein